MATYSTILRAHSSARNLNNVVSSPCSDGVRDLVRPMEFSGPERQLVEVWDCCTSQVSSGPVARMLSTGDFIGLAIATIALFNYQTRYSTLIFAV